MVDPGHHPGYSVLGLGQQRNDQVDLVVAGGGDDRVAAVQRGLVQRADLAGVGQQPLRPGQAVGLDRLGRLVDEQHLVPALQQLTGDGPADRAGSGDRDPHQRPPSGPAESTSETRSSSSSRAMTWITSPSCNTVPGLGTMASPSRSTNAIRVPAVISTALTFSPSHFSEKATSARTTLPVGSRHSGSAPSGSSLRSIWSAVQRTVATVGMPSRW